MYITQKRGDGYTSASCGQESLKEGSCHRMKSWRAAANEKYFSRFLSNSPHSRNFFFIRFTPF